MASFTASDDLRGAEFVDADLREARFVRANLGGAVLRGVDVQGLDLDSPWLLEDGGSLLVNGIDVVPLIDAELDRRYPGRSQRRAADPAALRAAWAAVQQVWADAIARAESMPPGTVDVSVAGEWSFAETLRHLVMATDIWFGGAVLEREQPIHPLGVPHSEYESDGYDMSVFATEAPSWAETLAVHAERVAMVSDYLATVTPDQLAAPRRHPWSPDAQVTVLACLHVILNEEWDHYRYAVRDLDALAAR